MSLRERRHTCELPMETVLAAEELVRDEIRKRCACVRQSELVTPYKLQRFPVGCDK